MKRLVVQDQDACMSCLACEIACSDAYYKYYVPSRAVLRIESGDNGEETLVCTQCGKCAEVCEAEAIAPNAKGVYMISKKKCTDCGKCIEACPYGIIAKDPQRNSPTKCVACGICVKACPVDVLVIQDA